MLGGNYSVVAKPMEWFQCENNWQAELIGLASSWYLMDLISSAMSFISWLERARATQSSPHLIANTKKKHTTFSYLNTFLYALSIIPSSAMQWQDQSYFMT